MHLQALANLIMYADRQSHLLSLTGFYWHLNKLSLNNFIKGMKSMTLNCFNEVLNSLIGSILHDYQNIKSYQWFYMVEITIHPQINLRKFHFGGYKMILEIFKYEL